jgi:diguanylate cyclase (GGDEF)-like protein
MGTHLDYATLFFSATVTSISATIAMHYVWRVHRGEPAIRYWSLGYLVCALGTLPFIFGITAHPLVSKGLGNTATVAGSTLLYIGTSKFLSRPIHGWFLTILYLPCFALNWYASAWNDSLAYRILACAIAAGPTYLLMARDLWRVPLGPESTICRLVGACWAAFALAAFARATALLFAGPGVNLSNEGIIQAVFFAVLQGVWILCAVGLLLMVSLRLQLRLNDLAGRDELTGILNRRAFHSQVGERRAHPARDKPWALLVLDIDNFKKINDQFGHEGGDMVLCGVVAAISGCLRAEDIFARAGGEEFWILLPNVSRAEAEQIAERVRASVERKNVRLGARSIQATVSIGMAAQSSAYDPQTLRTAFTGADHALYEAKLRGRNQVIGAESDGDRRRSGADHSEGGTSSDIRAAS